MKSRTFAHTHVLKRPDVRALPVGQYIRASLKGASCNRATAAARLPLGAINSPLPPVKACALALAQMSTSCTPSPHHQGKLVRFCMLPSMQHPQAGQDLASLQPLVKWLVPALSSPRPVPTVQQVSTTFPVQVSAAQPQSIWATLQPSSKYT